LRRAVERLTDVSDLVGDLAHLSDNPTKEQIAELRRRARSTVPGVEEFLRAYRDRPDARKNLDTSSLVGTKLSELRGFIKSLDSLNWFAAFKFSSRDHSELILVTLPDDQKGKRLMESGLILKLSGPPESNNEIVPSDLLENSFADMTVASAELVSGIEFRCVNPKRFDVVDTMSITSARYATMSSRQRNVGDELTLEQSISDIFFTNQVKRLKGQTWPLVIHAPDDVLKLFPGLVRSMAKNAFFEAHLCLRFAANRDMLTKAAIKVNGLRSAENEKIAQELTTLYRRAFHDKQDFLNSLDFKLDDRGVDAEVGSFVSAIAQIALVNASVGLTPDVSIVATRVENKIGLDIIKPPSTPDEIKTEQLNIQLTQNGIKILPTVAPSTK
jgi:hypothetical protein